MGYSNVHEFEDILEIRKGEISEINRVDNRKTSLEYLNSEKLTLHLIKELDRNILTKIWKNELELDFYVDLKSNKKREVIKVSFEHISEIGYENEIKKAILKIKDWDILFRQGLDYLIIDINRSKHNQRIIPIDILNIWSLSESFGLFLS